MEKLIPFTDVIHVDETTNVIFQQDNTSCHVSKTTQAFLQTAVTQHAFTTMEWLVNSPDMNLIENLWAHLKRELRKRYSDTLTLQEPPHTIHTALCQ